MVLTDAFWFSSFLLEFESKKCLSNSKNGSCRSNADSLDIFCLFPLFWQNRIQITFMWAFGIKMVSLLARRFSRQRYQTNTSWRWGFIFCESGDLNLEKSASRQSHCTRENTKQRTIVDVRLECVLDLLKIAPVDFYILMFWPIFCEWKKNIFCAVSKAHDKICFMRPKSSALVPPSYLRALFKWATRKIGVNVPHWKVTSYWVNKFHLCHRNSWNPMRNVPF